MFIDADIGFTATQVDRMLAYSHTGARHVPRWSEDPVGKWHGP